MPAPGFSASVTKSGRTLSGSPAGNTNGSIPIGGIGDKRFVRMIRHPFFLFSCVYVAGERGFSANSAWMCLARIWLPLLS